MKANFDQNKEAEDITIEPDSELRNEKEITEIEDTTEKKLKQLRDRLKQCNQDKVQALEETSRIKADFLNARKRLEAEKIREKEMVTMRHIENLLPLVDSIEIALSSEILKDVSDNIKKGLNGIKGQLSSILKNTKVEELGSLGELFDPSQHEAIAEAEVDNEGGDNTIVEVVQKGYRLEDRVIRPARVVVGVFKS